MSKLIALTFDDGPNTDTTLDVLEKLKKYDVVATFFLIADAINDRSAESVKKAIAMGCEIENHSKTHSYMDQLDEQTIKDEIKYTSEKIFEITGRMPEFFRPPYINVNETMVQAIDLPFICGHGGRDWEPDCPTDERASLILNAVSDGSIILLHDMSGNDKTVAALDIIIPELQKQGYEFVTVSQIFIRKGITPTVHSGIVYSDVTQTIRFDDPNYEG
ncbi:MAG: polysaccharide deacetylase family protein [Lachnospiraceae bacterium]|nr:polysaccharide deacetylase family protein [Lachnospiraceae bacterium]